MSFFQKVFMINMPLSCPCSIKKHQFCQKYTILWAPRVNMMPFSPIFLEKNNCSHAHISSKKRPFAKNHTAFMPKFSQKMSIFSKKLLLCHFFQIKLVTKKSPGLVPVFDRKMLILLKQHQFMGQKRQQNPLFFRFFTTKAGLMLTFC